MWGVKVANVRAKCSCWTMALILYDSHIFPEWSKVAGQLAKMSQRGIKIEYKEGDVYFSNVTNQLNSITDL